MNSRRNLVSLIAVLAVASQMLPAPAAEPLKVHMLSGAGEYNSEPSLIALKGYLEKHYRVECSLSLGRDGVQELPDLDQLDRADVMLVFCRRLRLVEKPMAAIRAWCRAGKPVVGIRTASHAFQPFLEFDREVLGGDYQGHLGWEDNTQVVIHEPAKDHPILAGVKPWTRGSKFYRNPNIAEDVALLLVGKGQRTTHPLAWTRTYDREHDGRSFYTSMGVPGDFENADFLRLLANAVFWTAHRDVEPK